MTRLFGTDGIRGVANEEPLTPDLAFRVGRQLVATLQFDHGADRVRLVIGRDTRRSGPLLEAALIAGALSAGADCYSVGVLPTPGIAVLTHHLEAHGGIVLSASHNPFEASSSSRPKGPSSRTRGRPRSSSGSTGRIARPAAAARRSASS